MGSHSVITPDEAQRLAVAALDELRARATPVTIGHIASHLAVSRVRARQVLQALQLRGLIRPAPVRVLSAALPGFEIADQ
jgi:predicted ArsR family transcriptional regulator